MLDSDALEVLARTLFELGRLARSLVSTSPLARQAAQLLLDRW
jgi:hypothetical protein